jgi:hypothetical protein
MAQGERLANAAHFPSEAEVIIDSPKLVSMTGSNRRDLQNERYQHGAPNRLRKYFVDHDTKYSPSTEIMARVNNHSCMAKNGIIDRPVVFM